MAGRWPCASTRRPRRGARVLAGSASGDPPWTRRPRTGSGTATSAGTISYMTDPKEACARDSGPPPSLQSSISEDHPQPRPPEVRASPSGARAGSSVGERRPFGGGQRSMLRAHLLSCAQSAEPTGRPSALGNLSSDRRALA
eukprot:UN2056